MINQLALSLLERGDDNGKRRALEFAQLNSKLNPKSPEILATLGWIHYQSGRTGEALKELNVALGNGPPGPEPAYYGAMVLKDQHHVNEALKLLEVALAAESAFAYRQEARELQTKLIKERSENPETAAAHGAKGAAVDGRKPTAGK